MRWRNCSVANSCGVFSILTHLLSPHHLRQHASVTHVGYRCAPDLLRLGAKNIEAYTDNTTTVARGFVESGTTRDGRTAAQRVQSGRVYYDRITFVTIDSAKISPLQQYAVPSICLLVPSRCLPQASPSRHRPQTATGKSSY